MSEPDQAAAIRFLSDRASHGGAEVKRIDTHASIVFLVGDRAFKLKRALKLPYLDYSTLAARERFCRAELALNRRTAPELYEDVRSITRDGDGRLGFDGSGVVVDWVVVMRRFDESTLFDHMAARGALTAPLMLQLAEQIARFHAAAEIDRESGGFTGLGMSIDSDARSLRAAVPEAFDAAQVDALVASIRGELSRLADLLDSRRRSGKVRQCHGDLHLRNICLVGGRPTLFDCIEFSRAIANIDLLYDLAFLLMDLHTRGLDRLGNAVLNRYLDVQDEADGLPALPLFLSVRAAVRAHVGAAAALQQSDPQRRAPLLEEARRYFGHAADLLRRHPPRLIAVGGLSGAGKSTVAYGLAPDLGAPPGARVLRSDVIRKRLFGAALTNRLPAAAYDAPTSERVFRELGQQAAAALAAGRCVVVDAVFANASERDAIAKVAARAQVRFVGLWLEAPAEVLAARIASRQGDASDATVAVLHRQLRYDVGHIDWHRVDAGAPPEIVLAAARQFA